MSFSSAYKGQSVLFTKKLGNLTRFCGRKMLYNLCPIQCMPLITPFMKQPDLLETEELNRLQIFIYLIPVLGFFPALWTLYRQAGAHPTGTSERSRQNASRLAVTLAMGWIVGYALLGAGAQAADSLTLPLLITSSLLTSGYFLVNIWLMVRLWQGRAIRLPGISRLSDRLP